MNDYERPRPTAESALRNVLQGITGMLETADPAQTRLALSREPLELWGHQMTSAILCMDMRQQGTPALGCGWGLGLVATITPMLVGLWLLRRCSCCIVRGTFWVPRRGERG